MKFVQGVQRYFKIVVNNEKIANWIGATVVPNHVKFIKTRFLRYLKERAKKNSLSPKEQLDIDVDNFNFDQMFPWMTRANISQSPIVGENPNPEENFPAKELPE